jgi:hypothetical protein
MWERYGRSRVMGKTWASRPTYPGPKTYKVTTRSPSSWHRSSPQTRSCRHLHLAGARPPHTFQAQRTVVNPTADQTGHPAATPRTAVLATHHPTYQHRIPRRCSVAAPGRHRRAAVGKSGPNCPRSSPQGPHHRLPRSLAKPASSPHRAGTNERRRHLKI